MHSLPGVTSDPAAFQPPLETGPALRAAPTVDYQALLGAGRAGLPRGRERPAVRPKRSAVTGILIDPPDVPVVARLGKAVGPSRRCWCWAKPVVVSAPCSRCCVGCSRRSDLQADLVLDALGMAVTARGAAGVVAPSDHGGRYASLAFGNDCAPAESFISPIRSEPIDRLFRKTRDQDRPAAVRYIGTFYNPLRRHSALGMRSPDRHTCIRDGSRSDRVTPRSERGSAPRRTRPRSVGRRRQGQRSSPRHPPASPPPCRTG